MILSYKFKLNTTQEQNTILLDTLNQYKQAINKPLKYGFKHKQVSGVELHKATYYPLRESTNLPSQLVCSARCKATEILKSIKTKTKGKFNTKQPKCHKYTSIRFDKNSCSISENMIKVSTTSGRIKLPFISYNLVKDINWNKIQNTCELKYHPTKKQWFLTVFVDKEPQETSDTGVLGIDRGCKHIAVCSNNKFFNSKHLRNVKSKYKYLRKRLQSKGTKSAKRLLGKVSRKENRFVRDVNHCISKKIVKMPFDTFVLEKLQIKKKKKFGKRFNSILSGWSYFQLEQFIKYKAELKNKQVAYVDARYTSQKCSNCGHTSRSNRDSQSSFCCKKCEFRLHADLNASRNIKENYIASLGISLTSRAQSIAHTTQSSTRLGSSPVALA